MSHPDNSNMSSLTRALSTPLAQFVDSLPLPRRLIAADHEGRLVVRLRPGEHRFHRDLPPSRIWGYDGTVPGPTIETERGHPKYEVWRLINLTGDTHPIHLHLDPFQIVSRRAMRYQVPEGGIQDVELTASVTLEPDPEDELLHTIDDNERGLKDTIRVNPHEIVEIAVRFTNYSGRYMYHCHILEHEDRDMMRPFVTMPPELMPFMA